MTPTVLERLREALERCPDAPALTLHEPGSPGGRQEFSYARLHALACGASQRLREFGLRRGDALVLAQPTGTASLGAYLASLYEGLVPVIVAPLRGDRDAAPWAAQVGELAQALDARRVFVAADALERLAGALDGRGAVLGELDERAPERDPVAPPEAVAHLQATSGSTGRPKLALIRHRNVAANVTAIGRAIDEREGDLIASWLPLYHDMGLICVSCALHWRRPLVLLDSALFARHPLRHWLGVVSAYGASISPAPASAYHVCAKLALARRVEALDLSRWRVGFCGAEPVHAATLELFRRAFAPHGLGDMTVLPVYGLAEATLAVTIPAVPSRAHVERVERATLADTRRAVTTAEGDGFDLVAVGRVLPGHELRLRADDGRELGEREVGEIEVRGPSVIDGYWSPQARAPEPVAGADGWLATGDLGFLAEGRLFVTGRKKDVVIHRGRNLLPDRVEALVGEALDGRLPGSVAAVGVWSESECTDLLHVLIESTPAPPPDAAAVEERLRRLLESAFDVSGATLHWVRKGELPKTTSGKIQRHRCRALLDGVKRGLAHSA
jgi:acyl-CoA synthetase (AMP-forming)/AMP-acid ligase II